MFPSGKRIELIQRTLKVNPGAGLRKIERGDYQDVFKVSDKWVVKMIQMDDFYELGTPGSLEWAQKLKNKVESHLNFLYSIFGDIYFKPRVFLGEAEAHYGRKMHAVYKAQRNLNSFEGIRYSPWGLPSYSQVKTLLRQNRQLRNDFKKLHSGWKKLDAMGLRLDLTQESGLKIIYEEINGVKIPRLKVYDSIPIFLTDEKKFTRSSHPDLITLDQANSGTKFHLSKDFRKDYISRLSENFLEKIWRFLNR